MQMITVAIISCRYHHITVLIYVWWSFSARLASARWFMSMNFGVHALMYSYYAARASQLWRPPRALPLVITLAQLTQVRR